MALHKTQCPHCFTAYVISDEQLRVSEGMVRCGTCRERFQARIVNSQETPRFDPRNAFIEPISEDISARPVHEPEEPREIEFADPHTESLEENDISLTSSLEESVNSELTIEIEEELESHQPLEPPALNEEVIRANIKAKQLKQQEISLPNKQDEPEQESGNPEQSKFDLPLPDPDDRRISIRKQAAGATSQHDSQKITETPNDADTSLVDKVDRLIDEKLIGNYAKQNTTEQSINEQDRNHSHQTTTNGWPTENIASNESLAPTQGPSRTKGGPEQKGDPGISAKSITTVRTRPISNPQTSDISALRAKPKRRILRGLLSLLFLLPIAATLTALLTYQLWHKQLLLLPSKSKAEQLMQSAALPIAEQLSKRNITLPVRRNLSMLDLVSARTEAHPSRSSTTLLRVSLINRADIGQPLPWMELSLRSSEGRLVARRQLSPKDYLYKNTTTARIGPKELKKITIELLAFPKQATGYELKLLNK